MRSDAKANGEAAAVWVEVGELVPWDKNPRHNDAAVADDRPGDRLRVVGCQDHAHPPRGMTPRLWSQVWLAVEEFERWQREHQAADAVARGDVTG